MLKLGMIMIQTAEF